MRIAVAAAAVAVSMSGGAAGANAAQCELTIPKTHEGAKRPIAIGDMARLRKIDSLSVSSDGQRYAIFVRQGDAETNDFRTAWFVGGVRGGALTSVGGGGEMGPTVRSNGLVDYEA